MFILVNVTYYIVWTVFSTICFYNFVIHTIWMIFLIFWCAKNGASYYMDYFSKKYESSLEVLELSLIHI